MTPAEAKRLQVNLAVAADGIIGRGTLAALFKRFGANDERASELALSGIVHMADKGILDTPNRLAHFMAQVAHESGGFRYMEEIASAQAYEGREDLGNVVAGDGRRYKGRGPLQLTGRANYRKFGRAVGVDMERHPEIAAYPSIGLWIACQYWADKALNQLADADDIVAVTRKVNGGQNGLADRKAYLAKAKVLFE